MLRVKICMTSGNLVEFECEELSKKTNGLGELVELNWTHGKSKERLLKINLSNIESIVVKDIEEVAD